MCDPPPFPYKCNRSDVAFFSDGFPNIDTFVQNEYLTPLWGPKDKNGKFRAENHQNIQYSSTNYGKGIHLKA